MAINFGTQFAITGFTLHLKDVAMATTFWLSMGYNFGCMIASDTLFDTVGGFSGSNYPMKTQPRLSFKGSLPWQPIFWD